MSAAVPVKGQARVEDSREDVQGGAWYSKLLCHTFDGVPVYDSDVTPRVRHRLLTHFVEAVISLHTAGRNFIADTVEFPYAIGPSAIVPVTVDDRIVYARHPKHRVYERCVLGRMPETSNQLTVLLRRRERNTGVCYTVITVWIGPRAAQRPQDIQKELRAGTNDLPAEELWTNSGRYWFGDGAGSPGHAYVFEEIYPTPQQITTDPPPSWRAMQDLVCQHRS